MIALRGNACRDELISLNDGLESQWVAGLQKATAATERHGSVEHVLTRRSRRNGAAERTDSVGPANSSIRSMPVAGNDRVMRSSKNRVTWLSSFRLAACHSIL